MRHQVITAKIPNINLTHDVIEVRITAEIKRQAYEVLGAMDLTLSEAVCMLCLKIAQDKKLPFAFDMPNKASLKALEELKRGEVRRYETAESFFEEMRA